MCWRGSGGCIVCVQMTFGALFMFRGLSGVEGLVREC
jgi:hypothetical protein